jgi:hypothetical protein
MGESEEPRPGFLQIVGVFGQRGACQMPLLSSIHRVVNTTRHPATFRCVRQEDHAFFRVGSAMVQVSDSENARAG